MPKRAFGEFYEGSTFANIDFQTPFRKTHVVGRKPGGTPQRSPQGSSGVGRPSGWTPTGSEGMPPRRKVMMVATRRRAVTHRMPGAVARGGNGPRRVFRPQGVGPRTGGFTGIERKFYDTSLVAASLTAPTDSTGGEHDQSATICLNTVIQGDGESNRDGRKCTFQSCFVKGLITCAAQANITAGLGATKVYIALVLDTQTNGAQLNSEDVFKNDSASGSMAASPMRNMQFTQRFRILDTAELIMADPNISYDGTNIEMNGIMQAFQLSTNLTFSSTYSATTETIANITDNSLHIIAFCNALGLVPKISYNARVRFVG